MDTRVVHANGYTFTIDEKTGTITANGFLQDSMAARNPYMQRIAGGELRLTDDQGGHVVAAKANGPAIKENLTPQNKDLNLSSIKQVENAELRLLKSPDCRGVETERIAYSSNAKTETGASRPDCYMINDRIYRGGQTETINFSFSNMSNEIMKKHEEIISSLKVLNEYPNPNDALRESMSTKQYADLMKKTDATMPGLGNSFDNEWTNSSSAQHTMEIDTNMNQGESHEPQSDVSVSIDNDYDYYVFGTLCRE